MFDIIITVFLIIVIIILILFLFFVIFYDFGHYVNVVNSDIFLLESKYLTKKKIKRDYKTIISLTTTPDRIDKIQNTLKSLLLQSERVDEIRVNVPYFNLKGKEYIIPDWMKKLKFIKIVRLEKDFGPSSKVLPVIEEYYRSNKINKNDSQIYQVNKDDVVIFLDDDIIYCSRLVETLILTYEQRGRKDAICSMGRKHTDTYFSGFMRRVFRSDYIDVLTGVDGCLVRVDMFPKEVFEYEKGPKEAIFVDDDWLSGWLRYNKIKIWSMGLKYKSGIYLNPETVETVALSKTVNKVNPNVDIVTKWFQEKEEKEEKEMK